MSQKITNTENNILIAEFVKLPTEIFTDNRLNYLFDGSYFEAEELSFDVSFDWLFTAVDAIESLKNEKGDNYRVTIHNETCSIDNNFFSSANCTSKLNAIYTVVLSFIKWYNEAILKDNQ